MRMRNPAANVASGQGRFLQIVSFFRVESRAGRYGNMGDERRRTLRYAFNAQAEVSDEKSESKLQMQVKEIGLNGCYLQTETPFPAGTPLFVKLFAEGSFFEGHATVAYSQPNQGMGVAFRDLKPYFITILKKWLLTAMLAKHRPKD
jgi:PilZ domain